jgi:hypothetical protein
MTRIKNRGPASSIFVFLALLCFAANRAHHNTLWEACGGVLLGIAAGTLLTRQPVWQMYRTGLSMLFKR